MNDTDTMEIDSLPFAATLLTLGKTCVAAKKHESKDWLRVFIFEDDGTLMNLRGDFFHRKLSVEPQAYWESTRTLKAMPITEE